MDPCKRRILGTSKAGTQLGVMTCFVRRYWLQPLEISKLLQNGVPLLPHFKLGGARDGNHARAKASLMSQPQRGYSLQQLFISFCARLRLHARTESPCVAV